MYVGISYKTQEQGNCFKSREGAKDPQLSWLNWEEPRQNKTGDWEKAEYVKGTLKQG